MFGEVDYEINRTNAAELIQKLGNYLARNPGPVRVSLYTFKDGDININVDGLSAATLIAREEEA